MPLNRQTNWLLINGYFDLPTLTAVVKEKLAYNNANASIGDVQEILLNVLHLIDTLEIPEPVEGGTGVPLFYNAGLGIGGDTSTPCTVFASGAGVTFSSGSGVGTITVPDGVYLYGFNVKGKTAMLDGSNNYTLRIHHLGTNNINLNLLNPYVPTFDLINAGAGTPTDGTPFLFDKDNTPQKQVIEITGNRVSIKVVSLNAFTEWMFVK